VHGQSRLVNVVLRPTADSGSPLTWVIGARQLQYADRIGYTLQLSKSFKLADNVELALDFQAPNLRGRTVAFEAVRGSAGALTRYREQYNQVNFNGLQAAANLKWRIDAADTLNINALYNPSDNSIGIGNVEFLPSSVISSSTYGRTEYPTQQRGELGGDWEHRFGATVSTKLIGLVTLSETDQEQVLSTYLSTGLANVRRQFTGAKNGERVVRGAMTWKASDMHTLEFGAEGAFNSRDNALSISNQAPGGSIVLVALEVANTRVEELRAEASVVDTWQVGAGLTLETGLNFEASRITQTGDESKQREFTYAKPSFAATWQPAPGNIIRASLKRDVSQLDFAEFATSVNSIDNITLVGNPDLAPEQAWKARIEWDRRFGARGAVTVGIFHDEVEDVRDLVVRDIDPGPGIRLADAVGNLGHGTRTGADLRGTLPLDFLGIKGADFRFNTIYQRTRVTDPLTGETRSFSSGDNSNQGPRSGGAGSGPPPLSVGNRDWGYVVSVRQELPQFKSSWSLSLARNAAREEFKLLEAITTDRPVERMDLSWETTAISGITVRLGVGNIFSPQEERVRTFYSPDRSSGIIARTESRMNKGGPDGTRSYTIQISGKF
jgi:Outer membrane protein beta-barrel family